MTKRIEQSDSSLSEDELVFAMTIGVHRRKNDAGASVVCSAYAVSPIDIHQEDSGYYFGTCPSCHQTVKFQYKPRAPDSSRWSTEFSR